MALSLRSNFQWTLAGNVVNAACWWGVVTALAKLGDAAMMGQFDLGMAIAAPVATFAMLQLRAIQVTDVARRHRFNDYFGTRIITAGLGFAVIAAIAIFGSYDRRTAGVIVLVGLVRSVESVAEIVRGLFQRHERMDLAGLSLMIRGLLTLGAAAVTLWLSRSLTLAMAATAIVGLAVLLALDLEFARRLLRILLPGDAAEASRVPSFNPAVAVSLSLRALPLGVVAVLLSLQFNIPKYMLAACCGQEALGYYGPLTYPAVAGTLIVAALGQSASPRLAAEFVAAPARFRRLMGRLLVIGLALGLAFVGVAWLAGRWLLPLLYNPNYAAYQKEFVIVAAGASLGFLASFCGFGVTAAQRFKAQVPVAAACCVAAAGAGAWLIPRHGVRGATLTLAATFAVMLALYALLLIPLLIVRRPPSSIPAQPSG